MKFYGPNHLIINVLEKDYVFLYLQIQSYFLICALEYTYTLALEH